MEYNYIVLYTTVKSIYFEALIIQNPLYLELFAILKWF